MDASTVIVSLLILGAVIGSIAYFLYRAKFRVTEAEVNTGIFKAKAERTPTDAGDKPAPAPSSTNPAHRTEVRQKARDGGRISNSPIKAPGDSGAKIDQESKGEDSSIDGSGVTLK